MHTILICDDEPDIVAALKIYLNAEGYHTLEASNGRQALDLLAQNEVHLLLLDIMMPGMDGIETLALLRKAYNLPVIMLTAKSTEYDKVLGLDTGADDYVAKPFGIMELLSRIRALLRRTEREEPAWRIGCLSVDPGCHAVMVEGQEVALTQKEFEVLCLLLRCAGQVVSRDRLIEEVWGYAFTGETRTVDVHIRTLRQKLGPAGQYVETVRGYGYKVSREG